MLQHLIEYATRNELCAEPGFKLKFVRWAISFEPDGTFLGVVPLGDVGNKRNPGRRFDKCPDLSQPELTSGVETRSHFLVDTAQVVALFGKGAEEPKIQAKHRYFLRLLREAGHDMPELANLADALSNSDVVGKIRARLEESRAKPTHNVTLSIGTNFPVDSDRWHDWWRNWRHNLASGCSKGSSRKATMRCLATGQLVKPSSTHPKIEGLGDVGGSPMGTSLIGFDKEAFCSYGLIQSANAAVSEDAAAAYRAAVNDLLREHSRAVAGAKVAHWFKRKIPHDHDPLHWLVEPPDIGERNAQALASELLTSVVTGKRPDLADNEYYALTLSGSGGRVMVRDWMEGQFEQLLKNVRDWFNDLGIVNLRGTGIAKTPGIERVVTSLLAPKARNQKYADWIKPVGPERMDLWHAAVRGDPVPYAVLARIVVEHGHFLLSGKLEEVRGQGDEPEAGVAISTLHARMGLMKVYHIRKAKMKGDPSMAEQFTSNLNEDHPDPAYHCGRLMALLAQLQRSALGDVGAGVVQRYYAAASATPALVLGRLTRTSQFHLNKLEAGLAHWYEQKIACIWARMKDAVPRTLDLEGQSIFALGYYHQLAQPKKQKSDIEKETTNE